MNRREILEKLQKKINQEIKILIIGKNERILNIKKMEYELMEDVLFLKDKIAQNCITVNLNTLRRVEEKEELIIMYLDDKTDTIIKIQL